MRILYFANNRTGLLILEWLIESGEDVAGVVLHPPDRRLFADELVAAAGSRPIFQADRLGDEGTLREIAALGADIGVSAFFGYILKPPLLELLPAGCVNVHPALLPYNRGAHPNVWSIVDGTPAGATLHYIDAGVDTGDIVAQVELPVTSVDTAATLYGKLEDACVDLFREAWPALREGTAPRRPQDPDAGTYHRRDDLKMIDRITLDDTYKARDLIDLLRARTFPPHAAAHFVDDDGRKVQVRVELSYETEDER